MQKSIRYQGIPVAYEVSGSGLPVMWIHGFTEDRLIWNEVLRGISGNYSFIIPDLPGSGQSPVNNKLHSIADFALVLKSILEEERIDQIVLIGHSMGGYISLSFAEQFPSSLKGLALFHSTAFADSPEKKETRKKSIDFIRKHGTAAYVEQSLPGLYSDEFKKRNPEKIQDQINRYRDLSPDALVQYLQAMMDRTEKTGLLKTIQVPMLFIMGEEDKAAPVKDVLQQCYLPRVSDIHILPGAHMGMVENARVCAGFISQFLETIALFAS